jgi:PAS domain S-box-containing protein
MNEIVDRLHDSTTAVAAGSPRSESGPAEAELRATRERLQFLLSSTPAMIYTCTATRELRVTFISPNAAVELGYGPRAFLEDPLFWSSRIHSDDLLRPEVNLRRVLETGHRVCEYRFLHEDGTYRWLRDEARLIVGTGGAPLEIAGYLLDITQRKKAEAELERKARQLAEAQSVAHVGSWDWDIEADTMEWSEELYRIFGLELGEFGGTYEAVWQLIHPDDREMLDQAVQRGFDGVRPYHVELRILRRDGAERSIFSRGVIVRDRHGRPIRMYGTAQDITERKRAEDALKHSEERLSAFLRNLPGAAFIQDRDGRYLYANAVAALRHAEPGAWHGKTISDVPSPNDAALLKANDRYVLESGEVLRTVEFITLQGQSEYWLVSKFPLPDAHGNANLLGGVGIDITEQKRVEEELRKSELRLRGMLEARERLSQDLHDGIVQTIYAVGFSLEECQRLIEENQRSAAVKTLAGAIGSLNGTIRDIRQFIGGREPESMTGRELHGELIELAKTVHAAHLVRLRVSVDPAAAAQLTPDEARHLLSIAREAMSNSLRHSRAGKAAVKLQATGTGVRFEVKDDGIGFDIEAVSTEGEGLKNIAARAGLIGARLEMISACGHGTRIVLNLTNKAAHANTHRRRGAAAHHR